MILEINKLNSYYGKSHILFDLNLQVEEGHTVCMLGRNGVGKSTTMKSIMGLLNPKNHNLTEGEILFEGKNIVGMTSYQIAQLGIAYVPQGRHIFSSLSTKENLLISKRIGVDGSNTWTLDRIYELFPRLKERESSKGGKLSGGEQQMLAIARGLMQNPKLLLLDEITEGLAPIIVQQLTEIIQKLTKGEVTILLSEQSIKFALSVSEKSYILEKGTVAYSDTTSNLGEEVLKKYLGA
ncbi:ABC transporter ATP-binding protein [uncultured Sphaerochaeta sp.]|uniref:ABC transporter ATP-binding protein n=1 Tax=uncultured Sphaerochaeta sp. TaxID=886478 RepID=UPI002A0A3582|nr:ABC transporter ATP-binding protein [uncultured Sphaerochaeta sp.]